MKSRRYEPGAGYLLAPSVRAVLGEKHLCFCIPAVVEGLDLSAIEADDGEEGRPAYAPAMLVKLWLYAYGLGITSSRRLEEGAREDLAFRFLAGQAEPEYWALNAFRRRQRGAERRVHAGGGSGAEFGDGEVGARGDRHDASGSG